MATTKLYMVKADEGSDWRLGIEADTKYADAHRPATDKDCTLEAMAGMLDRKAENANHHDFVGTHMAVGNLVESVCGRAQATKVMHAIVDAGGLRSMTENTR